MFRNRLLCSLFLTGFSILAVPTHAQGWGGGFGSHAYHGFLGSWIGASPYSAGRIPTPPYFALHPPVYYSMPVARPYGYSPYAYPGTVMTPEVTMEVAPEMIENPYVSPMSAPASHEKDATSDDFASRPQTILNPFATVSQPVSYVEAADE